MFGSFSQKVIGIVLTFNPFSFLLWDFFFNAVLASVEIYEVLWLWQRSIDSLLNKDSKFTVWMISGGKKQFGMFDIILS